MAPLGLAAIAPGDLHWTVWLAGTAVLILAVLFTMAFREWRMHVRVRGLLADRPRTIEELQIPADFERFLGEHMAYVTGEEMAEMRTILDLHPEVFEVRRPRLQSLLSQRIREVSGVEVIVYASALLILAGVGYIWWWVATAAPG